MKKLVLISAILCIAMVASAAPVSDGSLFHDDFSSGDLSNWKRVEGYASYDASSGNPAGSLRVNTLDYGNAEGFARPNMYWANNGQTEWVSEFDVKVSRDTGGSLYLFTPFNPNFWMETDITIRVEQFDWVGAQNAWDFHVFDATGSHGVNARLDASAWHHFAVYRKANATVELYVDGSLLNTYAARNPNEIFGELQIGDTSTGPGGQWGDVSWDNFSIGSPVPEPATLSLLAIGVLGLLKKRK